MVNEYPNETAYHYAVLDAPICDVIEIYSPNSSDEIYAADHEIIMGVANRYRADGVIDIPSFNNPRINSCP